MRILLVNDYAMPQGGAEILLLNLRTALRDRGHDARLFASNAGDRGADNLADYTCFGTTSRFRTLLQTVNPWAALRLRKVLAEFKPDVVHVKMFLTQLSPLILPVLRTFPCLYHVVWYRPICPLGTKMLPDRTVCRVAPGLVCRQTGCLPWRDWFLLMFQLKLWRRWRDVFDLIIANSAHVRARLLAEGIGPVKVVHNAVSPSRPRSAFSAAPTIAFAGRLVKEKGVDILLRAFAVVREQIPTATLVICGDGPERDSLARLVEELHLNGVSLAGFCDSERVEQILRDAWVVVVPSVWEEPFGHVALEAMMNGVAVVASDSGGLPEFVSDGKEGFLCPPADVHALATALIKICGDRRLAERLGAAAYQRASEQMNESALVDELLALYRSICRQGAA